MAAIRRFSTEAEAVAAANDTEHGLAAYLITADLDRARRVAGGCRPGWGAQPGSHIRRRGAVRWGQAVRTRP